MLITMQSYSCPDQLSLLHRDCVICGSTHPFGLKLRFVTTKPGEVRAQIRLDALWNGYATLLHGGVAASIVDGAMTHALFSSGIAAVTASLNVRYHHSIQNELHMEVKARLIQSRRHLHVMEATIFQDKCLCVSAEAKFMENETITTRSTHFNSNNKKESS